MSEDFSIPEAPGGDAQGNLTEAEAGELTSLKDEMADTRGADYSGNWASQYWHNTAKQDRARELMSREAGEPGDSPEPAGQAVAEGDVSGALDVLSGMGSIGADFAVEIGRGGAKPALETMMSVESDILADMGASADDVSRAFTGLPSNCPRRDL